MSDDLQSRPGEDSGPADTGPANADLGTAESPPTSSAGKAHEDPALSRIPFTDEDEANISGLAWWLRASAIVTLVTVAAGIVDIFRIGAYANVVGLIILTVCAVLSIQAASAFQKVATTDEADQDYLVAGFSKLRLAYLLLSVWIIVSLVFMCAAILFVMIMVVVRAAS